MSVSLRSASSRTASYGNSAIESAYAVTALSDLSATSAVNAIHLPSGETTGERCE